MDETWAAIIILSGTGRNTVSSLEKSTVHSKDACPKASEKSIVCVSSKPHVSVSHM